MHILLLATTVSLTDGAIVEPSIAHSVFLSSEFDPFCDSYVKAITRMSVNELMQLPKLSDNEFLNQLARGVNSIPGKKSLRNIRYYTNRIVEIH